MTREEAIDILQGAIKKPNTKDGYLGQAIDMAIKALEQEPITVDTITEYCKEHNYVLCEKGTEHGYMLVCPNCGLDVHSDFESCPRCGEKMKVGE